MASALVAVTHTPTAEANWFGASGNYGSCIGGNRSDAAPLTFTYVDLAAAMDNATDYARANAIQPAGLPTSYDATPPSSIDVIVLDRQYGDADQPGYCGRRWATSGTSGGTIGYTTCNSINASDQCQSADVRYNNNWTFDVGTNAERELACHENGHAIGLKHPSSSISAEMFAQGCMTTGAGKIDYTSHDRGHISAAY